MAPTQVTSPEESLLMQTQILLNEESVQVTSTTVLVDGTRFPLRNITSVAFVDRTQSLVRSGIVSKWLIWLFALPGLFILPVGVVINPGRVLEVPISILCLVGITLFALWLGPKSEKQLLSCPRYACNLTSGNQSAILLSNDRGLIERAVSSINTAIDTAAF